MLTIYTYDLEHGGVLEKAVPEFHDDVVAEGTQEFWRNESQLLQGDLDSLVIVFLDVVSNDEGGRANDQNEDSEKHTKNTSISTYSCQFIPARTYQRRQNVFKFLITDH